jgi:hypothetical protein
MALLYFYDQTQKEVAFLGSELVLSAKQDILEHIKLTPMENNSLKVMAYRMNRTTQLKVTIQH